MIYKIEEKTPHVTAIRFLFHLPLCNKSYLLVHGMRFKARSLLLTESHYFDFPCEMRDARCESAYVSSSICRPHSFRQSLVFSVYEGVLTK